MQSDFNKEKVSFLSKKDKSKKGSIDIHISNLISIINDKEDYYTTSSCSGRIVVLENVGNKLKSKWLYSTHDFANEKEIINALSIAQNASLRQESFILHIACSSIPSADQMLRVVKKAGLKRAGLISLSKKIVLEIIGTAHLDMPLAIDGVKIIGNENIIKLVKVANDRQKLNHLTIKKLEKNLSFS